jgi:hypothetical protein
MRLLDNGKLFLGKRIATFASNTDTSVYFTAEKIGAQGFSRR